MGNSCIIIRTIGPHHNNLSCDAERIASRTVDELLSYGHQILTASVETGGSSIELHPSPSLVPLDNPDEPGRAAYERYLHSRSFVSGAELPGFDALDDAIKAAWCAAADPSSPRLRR